MCRVPRRRRPATVRSIRPYETPGRRTHRDCVGAGADRCDDVRVEARQQQDATRFVAARIRALGRQPCLPAVDLDLDHRVGVGSEDPAGRGRVGSPPAPKSSWLAGPYVSRNRDTISRSAASESPSSHRTSGSQLRGSVNVTVRSRSGPKQSRPLAAAGLSMTPHPDRIRSTSSGTEYGRDLGGELLPRQHAARQDLTDRFGDAPEVVGGDAVVLLPAQREPRPLPLPERGHPGRQLGGGEQMQVPLMPQVFTRLRRCHNASSMSVGGSRSSGCRRSTRLPTPPARAHRRGGRPRPPDRKPDPAGAGGRGGGPWPAQGSARARRHHNMGGRRFQFLASGG